MEKIVVTFFNALTLTMILSLIALGLAVIFGLRGVINLAHGEFFMLGAYAVVAADYFLPSFWGGFVLAPLAVAGLGWVVERSIIRFLYEKPLDTLLATWGLSIVLREIVRLTIGAGYRYTSVPFSGKARIFSALIIRSTVFHYRADRRGVHGRGVLLSVHALRAADQGGDRRQGYGRSPGHQYFTGRPDRFRPRLGDGEAWPAL